KAADGHAGVRQPADLALDVDAANAEGVEVAAGEVFREDVRGAGADVGIDALAARREVPARGGADRKELQRSEVGGGGRIEPRPAVVAEPGRGELVRDVLARDMLDARAEAAAAVERERGAVGVGRTGVGERGVD